jgi:sialic acid synthase SpsE
MEFKIGDKKIGDNHPVFIIAEAGVNNNVALSSFTSPENEYYKKIKNIVKLKQD